MRRFNFKLEAVLKFRESLEQGAKDEYHDRRAAVLEAEAAIAVIDAKRKSMLLIEVPDLLSRQALEFSLQHEDSQERMHRIALGVLKDEEAKALKAWTIKRQELEVVIKLKEKALAAYREEADKEEQNALDEWATLRRAA